MLRIIYSDEGYTVGDFDIEHEYRRVLKNPQGNRHVDCIVFVDRIRQGIVEGDLSCDDVEFVIDDTVLKVNKYGAWPGNMPLDFSPAYIQICESILRAATAMRKKERMQKESV
jgi:hypothetical protein